MKIKDFIIFLLAILIVTFVIALGAIGLYLYNETKIEQRLLIEKKTSVSDFKGYETVWMQT